MSATIDTFHPDFVLAALDAEEYGISARDEEGTENWETRYLLFEICAPVEEIVSEMVGDIADFAADLDELSERYFH